MVRWQIVYALDCKPSLGRLNSYSDLQDKQVYALLAELVDAPDLGSGAERREGSNPLGGTKNLHDTRSTM